MKDKKDSAAEAMRRSAERKKKARNTTSASPLKGVGVFGIVGWSVSVPTVGGALLGGWLDKVAPQPFSWPMALMLAGMVIGIILAWNWIDKESSAKNDEEQQ